MSKTIIIAEIGECFNGDLQRAKKLITIAKDAGCDIVKFQTLDYENISIDDPERDWFLRIALNPKKINFLIRHARKIDITILFTPENIKTAKWILDEGLGAVKIASSSILDMNFIKFVNNNFKKAFLSTGMASLHDVERAVSALNKVDDLYIMHCVSEYPTGPLLNKRGLKVLAHEDVRLNMMKMLIKLFPRYRIGYSDHTAGILACVAAVASGAKVIEKHITIDRDKFVKSFGKGKDYFGTDHILSLEPNELKEMVSQIREVEKMFLVKSWCRSDGEKILKIFLRKRFTGGKN